MAVNNGIASIIFLFFLLTTLTGTTSQEQPAKTAPPATGKCPAEYINYHIIGLSEKTKDFVKEDILKRINDKNIKGADRECLNKIFNSYQAALGSVERAINDFAVKRYPEASQGVTSYMQTVEGSLKCSPGTSSISPDYTEMERWAQFTAQDLIEKIKGCSA
ncbi:hypothetical protein M9H77_16597 [Catharanthus roseus]|uniref:Uncharacterized protein n=1 Tax=Catharanthus roseus TaxID=4058 RepID=A0ACC0B276_CATRO|nr:hypothetical protein M9H77_16597 [Catharanthus roseus]